MNHSRNAALLALLGIALSVLSPVLSATNKIEAFTIKQKTTGNKLPELHLVWEESAGRWLPEPDDEVLVVFEFGPGPKNAQAPTGDVKISVKLDNQDAEAPLRHSGRIELRRAGIAFNAIKAEALRTCQKVRRDPRMPTREQRFTRRFPATAQAIASSGEAIASGRTTVSIVVVCKTS